MGKGALDNEVVYIIFCHAVWPSILVSKGKLARDLLE